MEVLGVVAGVAVLLSLYVALLLYTANALSQEMLNATFNSSAQDGSAQEGNPPSFWE